MLHHTDKTRRIEQILDNPLGIVWQRRRAFKCYELFSMTASEYNTYWPYFTIIWKLQSRLVHGKVKEAENGREGESLTAKLRYRCSMYRYRKEPTATGKKAVVVSNHFHCNCETYVVKESVMTEYGRERVCQYRFYRPNPCAHNDSIDEPDIKVVNQAVRDAMTSHILCLGDLNRALKTCYVKESASERALRDAGRFKQLTRHDVRCMVKFLKPETDNRFIGAGETSQQHLEDTAHESSKRHPHDCDS